jgi:hypothetical protein
MEMGKAILHTYLAPFLGHSFYLLLGVFCTTNSSSLIVTFLSLQAQISMTHTDMERIPFGNLFWTWLSFQELGISRDFIYL